MEIDTPQNNFILDFFINKKSPLKKVWFRGFELVLCENMVWRVIIIGPSFGL
jgi:hypothetical protein